MNINSCIFVNFKEDTMHISIHARPILLFWKGRSTTAKKLEGNIITFSIGVYTTGSLFAASSTLSI